MTIYDELVARGLIAQVTDEEEIKELKQSMFNETNDSKKKRIQVKSVHRANF